MNFTVLYLFLFYNSILGLNYVNYLNKVLVASVKGEYCAGYLVTFEDILIDMKFLEGKDLRKMAAYFQDDYESANEDYDLKIGADIYKFNGKKYELKEIVGYYGIF